MRIMVKGGVWKNTEDEILKAAVMKYGKNQWARISSLLVRKSAKQCKARWYEWLDPSIKKTEWSREEEEKLLHLAKIMPNQWKTIAPIVGRTASQCLEHYEKLLDAAQNREEGYDVTEDPRRLRPGEIDPNPEAKPARPDPIDMDEDEKEMLSEARARLANTKGKKAKRKAREKQLEEARRLAALQKKRELKAAGIELTRTGGRRKHKGIDYNKEIPFQRKPAPGFYEVDWEAETPKPGFKKVDLEQLEGKRRRDQEEEDRKEDTKKQKLLSKKNLPAHIMQINKLNDPDTITKRSKLMLPSPQLDDRTLEELAKNGATEEEITASLLEEGSAATKALLPSYSATPTPIRQPMRTPLPARTPAREDIIQKEVQNLIALTAAATPLLGGENPMLHESDFSRATPKPQEIRTPNVLANTPARHEFATPARPMRTPARDNMRINEAKELEVQNITSNIRKQLSMLPAPQNDYQIVLPDMPAEETEEREEIIENDSSELLERQQQKEDEEEARKLRLRSQVLKRNLPRPFSINKLFLDFDSKNSNTQLKEAEELLRQEMIQLISFEAVVYPFKQSKINQTQPYPEFEETNLKKAADMIAEEVKSMKETLYSKGFSMEEFEKACNDCKEELVYLSSQKKYGRTSTLSKKEKVDTLSNEFENIKQQMGREANRAKKLAQKLDIYNGGYYARAGGLLKQIQMLNEQLYQSQTELECFSELQKMERRAMPARIERMANEVQQLETIESELQRKYVNLKTERDQLISVSS